MISSIKLVIKSELGKGLLRFRTLGHLEDVESDRLTEWTTLANRDEITQCDVSEAGRNVSREGLVSFLVTLQRKTFKINLVESVV